MQAGQPPDEETRPTPTLGTFGGVFVPSLLTILGIILFRRLGYVVGEAGLGHALIIIGFASTISILTSISLAAVATNFQVGAGGPYYLISRTLGVAFGGAIGVVLFLAQSISIAFYCIGFAETVVGLFSVNSSFWQPVIAGAAVLFLLVFAWLGADWATRLQYVVMGILLAALVSFFAGAAVGWNSELLAQNWPSPKTTPGFWLLFAVFFPAITGFTQGVSMSGDLKDPGRSIQTGTFSAVGLSILIYMVAAGAMAATLPRGVMTGDFGAMGRVAVFPQLIDAGVIAATLSSAMASFLGAPRILQSIARDRIFPLLTFFGAGFGPTANPRRAILLSAGIALGAVSLGQLNVIAPVITMFFLISYGLLNYATFYEARAASPSFRPRFRWFDYRLSLMGAAGCLAAMAAIDWAASGVAIALLFAIYQWLKRTAGPARWANSRRSYQFQRIRENLLEMNDEPEHPRDWRPCILVFCDEADSRRRLLRFASWIEGGTGLTTAVGVLEGSDDRALRLREKTEKELHAEIREEGLDVFTRVIVAADFRSGINSLVQSFGIGGIRANVVLLNKFDQLPKLADDPEEIRYVRQLQEAVRLGLNVVVLDADHDRWTALEALAQEKRRIDVWWWGDKTSHLMLLLAYLMTRTDAWHDASIRLMTSSSDYAEEKTRERLKQTLEQVRIEAEPMVVENITAETVARESGRSALVFFPLYFREWNLLADADTATNSFFEKMPITGFCLAAADIDLEAGPEEGEIAEAAAAHDLAVDLDGQASAAEEEAIKLTRAVDERRKAREEVGTQPDQSAETALQELREAATQAAKKAADLRAQADEAAKAAVELGAKLPSDKVRC